MAAQESEVKLTIGAERVDTADVTKGQEIDLKSRDPEHLHDDMRIQFHDLFGEPDETVFSFDFVWRWAFKLFTNTKLWCYRITSLICGLPLAIYWGVYFACLAFCTIWCCEPYLKAFAIEMSCLRKIFNAILSAFFRPCYEAMGYIFYNIRIQKKLSDTSQMLMPDTFQVPAVMKCCDYILETYIAADALIPAGPKPGKGGGGAG